MYQLNNKATKRERERERETTGQKKVIINMLYIYM